MKNLFPIGLCVLFLFVLNACGKTSTSEVGNAGKIPNPSTTGNNAQTGNSGNAPAGEFKVLPGQTSLIQFSKLVEDFQPVISGDTVHAVYPFKNTSQQTVRITQAVTSCNCMQTKFTEGNIQPGQMGQVEVRFLTEGNKGRHEKIIAVVLEGVEESITLRLNGQINEK